MLTVQSLSKIYKEKPAVQNLNFSLKDGYCTALIGPNGAGKTTTLKMLSGLLKPSEGTIKFQGFGEKTDIRKLIGYLPQFPVFYSWMTGLEFLMYVGKLGGLTKNEAVERSNELLDVVGLNEAKSTRISKYSGGMKQRLGIAQAIIHKPKLVMLDEPVSALDPIGRREVLDLMITLKKTRTILFSTHILNDAEEVCDDILFLYNGEIAEQGSVADLEHKYQTGKIELEFSSTPPAALMDLNLKEYVNDIKIEANKMFLLTEDLNSARNWILENAIQENWPIIKFQAGKSSLEDLFMKVVKK